MLNWAKRRFAAFTFPPKQDECNAPLPQLLQLPQELLDNIVSFLDLHEAACLSVCSKCLYQKLGTDRWQLLRLGHGHDHQREEFLSRLACDNPKLFFCHVCSCLHLVARVGPALLYRLPCNKFLSGRDTPLESFELYGTISHYRPTFPHIQLVMAAHRKGRDHGIPISALSITEILKSTEKVWTMFSAEPRIINNELFLRVQQWTVFNQDDQPTFEKRCGPSICAHIHNFAGESLGTTTLDLLECQTRHIGARASCSACSALYRCIECSTEFESDVIQLEGRNLAVIVTKWLNLGDGTSPSDLKWLRHLYPAREVYPVSVVEDALNSKSIFEAHEGRSQAAMVHDNASLLRGEAFRRELYWVLGHRWRDQV